METKVEPTIVAPVYGTAPGTKKGDSKYIDEKISERKFQNF